MTLIAVGHLNSLRKVSERNRKWYYDVIGFLFMPTLPVAQLLYYSFRSITKPLEHKSEINPGAPSNGRYFGFKYHLAATLGSHVTVSSEKPSVPLIDVDRGDVEHEQGCGMRQQIGRVVVLMIFIIQAVLAFVLYIRRWSHGRAEYLDHRNGLVALGGLIAGIISFGITSMNLSWKYKTDKRVRIRSSIHPSIPLTTQQPPVDRTEDFPSIDESREYLLSVLLYLLWTSLSTRELFEFPLDYFSSLLTLYNSVEDANGPNKLLGAALLFTWAANTIYLLAFPPSVLLLLIRRYPGYRQFISLFIAPVICLSVSITTSILIIELISFPCPTSLATCEPLCWKDPLAEKLWTF